MKINYKVYSILFLFLLTLFSFKCVYSQSVFKPNTEKHYLIKSKGQIIGYSVYKVGSKMHLAGEDFIKYRSASQHWNDSNYGRNLKTFENYCIKTYPTATSLTQEMVDSWCVQREKEKPKSCATRIDVIICFIKCLEK